LTGINPKWKAHYWTRLNFRSKSSGSVGNYFAGEIRLTVSATSTPSDPQRVVQLAIFRTPAWARYFALLATLFLGAVTVFMMFFAILLIFNGSWGLGAVVAALGTFIAALWGHMLRDFWGRWGLRVALLGDHMKLDLPTGRSLVHRPVAQHMTIPYSDIESVETRLEAFSSLGMLILQRPFVLSLKHDDPIFLFEDRAIGSPIETPIYEPIAAAIVARANVPLRDHGMVKGDGGFLSVWGTHVPDWAAPSLPLALQIRIWRHAATTGTLAIALVLLAIVMRALIH
jgi:hypothetical protein